MKPSPRAVAFISAHQHHRAQNAVGPQRLSANPSLVGHKCPSTLLLPILGCSVALHPIYKVDTGPSSCRSFQGKYTDKWALLRFYGGCWQFIIYFIYGACDCFMSHSLGSAPHHPAVAEGDLQKTQVWVLCKAWKIALKPLCAPVCLKQSR